MNDDPLDTTTPTDAPEVATETSAMVTPAPEPEATGVHLPNPFIPDDAAKPAVPTDPTTFEQAKKLWLGGEHARARAIFAGLDLSDEEKAELPKLPGWADE